MKQVALRFILLLGIVSLSADVTYEGARSIAGPFFALLGASATAVGMIAGLGELAGYGLRLISGYLADRTKQYWAVTLVGYGLNLFAVPLLALAGRWELAALLFIAERVGKGIRTPARDAMLSHAAATVGRGWGFGLHEMLDQVGAVLGPLVVAAVLYTSGSYRLAFGALLVPALVALVALGVARAQYPHPRDLETTAGGLEARGLPRAFWVYLIAVGFIAAGYVDFSLMAYHFKLRSVAPENWIPVFYAIAMGVDALGALLFGRMYDRAGIGVLTAVPVLSALAAPLVFLGGQGAAWGGVILWGMGIGVQESVMRAAVGGMVGVEKRGSAYGLFNAAFGVFWFLGSALMGMLYDVSLRSLVGFSILTQLAAIPPLLLTAKQFRSAHRS
ncbi:MAG: MFS transporter [Armatimonadota bacterium]|nr:MFS transporter [Armatimonadota bacterium]MDR5703616.1 MFS transporter [Armatimonadota bacterium]